MINKLKLFDTHCHLDDKKLVGDLAGVLQRAEEAGLVGMATIGCDYRSSLFALHLAEKYPQVVAAVGVHPSDADTLDDALYNELAEMASADKARAIGEIGLDYHWDDVPRDVQKQAFIRQIHLAKDLKMPIVIHDREAHGDLFNICRRENAGEFGGIMHCFSGSWELAKEAMRMGFMISAGGPLTFKNSRQLPEVVKNIPLDYLLLETALICRPNLTEAKPTNRKTFFSWRNVLPKFEALKWRKLPILQRKMPKNSTKSSSRSQKNKNFIKNLL